MISQKAIDEMSQDGDVAWVTALRSSSIRTLVEQHHLQLGLFDERNLLEISSPDFPGERLVACRNPELAKMRGAGDAASFQITTMPTDKQKRALELIGQIKM